MRRVLLSLVFVVALPLPAGADPRACPASSPAAQGRLEDVPFQSAALGAQTRICVLLPSGYTSSGRDYPVLYLLHGAGDHNDTWMANTDVEEATLGLDVIVVMPDAGNAPDAGWYSDWVDGPRWESYHIGELVPFVDSRYRTFPEREARAAAGLSMGGFGAMSYAARHPELFAAAASFSGAVDSSDGGVAQALAYKALKPYFGTPDERVWGDYVTDEVGWRAHNPPDLSTNLRWTDLWLSTGNGVPAAGDNPTGSGAEAGVYSQNVVFHQDLESEDIAHEWRDRGYGTHSWNYWQADLHDWLPHMMRVFAAPPAPPAGFGYRSAEPSFEAWGWSFRPLRAVREFLDLGLVGSDGMRVRGSGALEATSPPFWYQPGREYVVSVDGVVRETPAADASGVLRFTVPLGPSHTAQQYTIEGRVAETAGGPGYWTNAIVTISPAS